MNCVVSDAGLSLPLFSMELPERGVSPSPLCLVDNREALHRKLLTRRSLGELRDRGIYPKSTLASTLAERQRQLLRAKTGDFLRHKIECRPNRQELIDHHILEDTSVDPSLHDAQRLLRRAQLVDQLNEKLQQRPDNDELRHRNILLPLDTSPQQPDTQAAFDDSQLSPEACSPLLAASSPEQQAADLPLQSVRHTMRSNGATRRNRPKVIKFHEYTGPKPKSVTSRSAQRVALMQKQMAGAINLPLAANRLSTPETANLQPSVNSQAPLAASTPLDTCRPSLLHRSPQETVSERPHASKGERSDRWQEMKVSDLRDECRRQGLLVSGPKPALVKRLQDWFARSAAQHSLPLPRSTACSQYALVAQPVTSPLAPKAPSVSEAPCPRELPPELPSPLQLPTSPRLPAPPTLQVPSQAGQVPPNLSHNLMLMASSSNATALNLMLPTRMIAASPSVSSPHSSGSNFPPPPPSARPQDPTPLQIDPLKLGEQPPRARSGAEQDRLVAEQRQQIKELQHKLLESQRKLQELESNAEVLGCSKFSDHQMTEAEPSVLKRYLGQDIASVHTDERVYKASQRQDIPSPPPLPPLDVEAFFTSNEMRTSNGQEPDQSCQLPEVDTMDVDLLDLLELPAEPSPLWTDSDLPSMLMQSTHYQ